MSTHPILPDTKVPQPGWVEHRHEGWYYFETDGNADASGQSWLDYGWIRYSTLPPSQRPEGVPNDSAHGLPKSCLNEEGSAVTTIRSSEIADPSITPQLLPGETSSKPHPTLAQLVEGAARDIDALADAWDNHAEPYSQSDVRHAILRHLSPEWERMVRERDDVSFAYDRLLAIHGTVLDDIAALRTENERLAKEVEEANKVNEDFDAACAEVAYFKANGGSIEELVNLRTRLRELEEDKARLDWISEMDALPEWDDNGFWKIRYAGKWYSGNTVRAAIDSARKEAHP